MNSIFRAVYMLKVFLVIFMLSMVYCPGTSAKETHKKEISEADLKKGAFEKTKNFEQGPTNNTGLLKEIVHYDESGVITRVDQYLNRQRMQRGDYYIQSTAYDNKGRKKSVTKFYTKKQQVKTGILKSIFHLRPDGSKESVALFYNMEFSEKGFYKIIFYYDVNGNELKHEGYFTRKKSENYGYSKAIFYINLSGKVTKEEWVMVPSYVKKEKVERVIFYFDSKGKTVQQEGLFTKEQSHKQGFYKAVLYFDKKKDKYKEERFYTRDNATEKGFVKGTAYFGRLNELVKQERLNQYGNIIPISDLKRW